MWSICKIVNSYYWKSIFGPVISFVFPLVYIVIIGSIFNFWSEIVPSSILPGSYLFSTIAITLLAIPQTLFEFKKTIIIKRMGASVVKPWMFLLTVLMYYFVVIIVAFLWVILLSVFVLWPSRQYVFNMFETANYGYVIYTLLITYLMGLSIGMLFETFAKTTVQIQIFGLVVIILSMLLSGLALPIQLVYANNDPRVLSYFNPFTYTTSLAVESWFSERGTYNLLGSSIFSPGDFYATNILTDTGGATVILDATDKWLDLFIPWLITIGSFSIVKFNFQWTKR